MLGGGDTGQSRFGVEVVGEVGEVSRDTLDWVTRDQLAWGSPSAPSGGERARETGGSVG